MSLLPEQTQYYRDLYERAKGIKLPADFDERKKEYGEIRQDLASFIDAKSAEIGKILARARAAKPASYEFSNELVSVLAGERERLGIPKFVPLDRLMAFVEYRHTNRLDLPYDAFVRMIPSKALKKADGIKPPRIDTLIANQGSYLAQGLVELIANGIDASVPEKSIGRFGEGFFQAFQFLKTEKDRLVVETKTAKHAGVRVEFRKRNGEIQVSMREGGSDFPNGTSVRLERGEAEETENTVEFLKSKFATGIRANVEINGERANRIERYRYMNGETLPLSRELPTVSVRVSDRGFEVIDRGEGMSGATVAEKLLYPNASTKGKRAPKEDAIEADVRRETKIFFQNGRKKKEKTKIRLQVSGVGIEEIETETSHGIRVCAIELPSWTWLPESRNQIQPTKEVVLAIKSGLEKINAQGSDLEEKLALMEIFSKVVDRLKGRQVGETNRAMKLENVAKSGFEPIRKELESAGITVLPADAELMDRIGERENVRYVSPDFTKLDLAAIPGIAELADVEKAKCPFYAAKFAPASEHDYLITPKGVLVNADKLGTVEERATLNAAINLAIGYEIESEQKAKFRGRITGDGMREVLKKARNNDSLGIGKETFAIGGVESNEDRMESDTEGTTTEAKEWGRVLATLQSILSEPLFQRILEEDEYETYREIRQERVEMAKESGGRNFFEMPKEESIAIYLQGWLRQMGHRLDRTSASELRLWALEDILNSRNTPKTFGIFSMGNIPEFITLMSPVSEKLFSILTFHDFSAQNLKQIFQLSWELAFQKDIPDDIRVRYADRFLDVLDADPKFALATMNRFSKLYRPEALKDEGFRIFSLVAEVERAEEPEGSEKPERADESPSGPNVKFRQTFEIEWQASLLNGRNRAAWTALKIAHACIDEAAFRLKKAWVDDSIASGYVFQCFDNWFFSTHGHGLEYVDTVSLEDIHKHLETLGDPIKKQETYWEALGGELNYPTCLIDGPVALVTEREILGRILRSQEQLGRFFDFPKEGSMITDRPSIWNPEFSGIFWQYAVLSDLTSGVISDLSERFGDEIGERIIDGMKKRHEDSFVFGSSWALYSDLYKNTELRDALQSLSVEKYSELMRRIFQYRASFDGEWITDEDVLMEIKLSEDFPEIDPFLPDLLDFSDIHFKLFDEFGHFIYDCPVPYPVYLQKSHYQKEDSKEPTAGTVEPNYREKPEVPDDWNSLLSPKNRYLRIMIGCSLKLAKDSADEGEVVKYLFSIMGRAGQDQANRMFTGILHYDSCYIDIDAVPADIGNYAEFLGDLEDEYSERSEKPHSPLMDLESEFISKTVPPSQAFFFINHAGSKYVVTDRPSLWNPELSGAFFANKFMNQFYVETPTAPPSKNHIYPKLYQNPTWRDFLKSLPYERYLKFMKALREILLEWATTADLDRVDVSSDHMGKYLGTLTLHLAEKLGMNADRTNGAFLELFSTLNLISLSDLADFTKAHFTFFDDEGSYVYKKEIPLPIFEGKTEYGTKKPVSFEMLFEEAFLETASKAAKTKETSDWKSHDRRETFRNELKKFPQDLVAFVEFLYHGGEYLKESPGEVEIRRESAVSIRLSELTSLSRFESERLAAMEGIGELLSLREEFRAKNPDTGLYCDAIAASIDGQDHSTMIWTREAVQNGIDAIKRERKTANREPLDSDRIDFAHFAENGHYGVRISDSVGMDFSEVNNKLLIIGESGKTPGEGVGMFGQGFYSLAIGAKEIRIKTGTGDGQATLVRMVPIHDRDGAIRDFEISQELRQEAFKGTVIERIDESDGFSANLRAMMGNAYLQKYAGNVAGIPIIAQGRRINAPLVSQGVVRVEIPRVWTLRVIETPDKIERLTKDDLYVSEIPQEFLSDLPDWMEKTIRDRNLTIDLPSGVPLTKSRNAMANFEAQMGVLRPAILKALCEYVLECYAEHDIKIPMLPEDYYAIPHYEERRNSPVTELANAINAAGSANVPDLGSDFRRLLKDDQRNMAEFLTRVEFSLGGKRTTLQKIKSDLLSTRRVSGDFGSANFTQKLRDNLEFVFDSEKTGDRPLERNEMPALLETTKEAFDAFEKALLEAFSPLIPGGISLRYVDSVKSVEGWAAPGGRNVMLNLPYVREIFSDYRSPKTWEKIVTTLTHEETHLIEDGGFWTHQLLTDHPKSFERVQRGLLTKLLRNYSTFPQTNSSMAA